MIIPAHRRPELLDRAIHSVIGQTHPNWELVVVVDGADEEVVEVAESANDERVRCLPVPHAGAAVARNHRMPYTKRLEERQLFQ